MDRVVRESVLWGFVGGLTFLVLAQGYELVVGPGIDASVKVGGAVVVLVVATGSSYLARRRLPDRAGTDEDGSGR